MKGRLISIGIVVGLVLIGISGCWYAYSPTYFRYRMTIEVNDGNMIRSGSGVIEVAYSGPVLRNLPGPQIGADVQGNAVTVDLGPKGLLFAIFRVGNYGTFSMGEIPIAAYGLKNPGDSPELLEADLSQLKRKSGWVEVPKDFQPTLIRFSDIDDPNSAGKVDASNLGASFGAGVELKSVKLELTNDPITPVPSVWPAWLKELAANQYLGGDSICVVQNTPLCLQGADFKGS
jgi:hypothetical protein